MAGTGSKLTIAEAEYLKKIYGSETTLDQLVKRVQGNKIYECPKCHGEGKILKRINTAQYWECCESWKTVECTCDLCNGEGYTEHEYKPRMIQDGWEEAW